MASPLTYNPGIDSIVLARAVGALYYSIDSRSTYPDTDRFVRRPFQSLEFVKSYFNNEDFRRGMFSIYVNETGTLNTSTGYIDGGVTKEYWWKEEDLSNDGLVEKSVDLTDYATLVYVDEQISGLLVALNAETTRATTKENQLDQKIDDGLETWLNPITPTVGGQSIFIIPDASGYEVTEVNRSGSVTYTNPVGAGASDPNKTFAYDMATGTVTLPDTLFPPEFIKAKIRKLTDPDRIPETLFTQAQYEELVKPVIDKFEKTDNLLDNSLMVSGTYTTNGTVSPNDNRITTAKFDIDITKSYTVSGIGVISTASPRFHFWTSAGVYVGNIPIQPINGYVLSNGQTSQTITPADYPPTTAKVTVQVANVTDIGLDPTNSAFKDTAMFAEGTSAVAWQPFGTLLNPSQVNYPIAQKDAELETKLSGVLYPSRNRVDMTIDVVRGGYLLNGNFSGFNNNRLGLNRRLVNSSDIGKKFTISGIGGVPSTYAIVVIRDSGGTVLLAIPGQDLNTPTEVTFEMPVGAYDEGLSVTAQAGIGDILFDNTYTYTYQYEEGEDATQATIPSRSYVSAEKVVGLNTEDNPNGFVSYNPTGGTGEATGREQIIFYTKRGTSNRYVGIRVEHEYNMDPVVYKDLFRIVRAADFRYIDGAMVQVSADTIFGGESECVYQDMRGGKADFTGGVHGDEIYSEFAFFIDGVKQDMAIPLSLIPCNSAHYIQKSTMYETANAGPVPIPGHPQNNTHYKKTTFKDGYYETENALVWIASFPIFWYHGISCVGKSGASWAYDEDLTTFEMTGLNVLRFEKIGLKKIEYYSLTNKLAVTATSTITSNSVPDANCVVFVDDRTSDSKYYRKTPTYTTVIGQRDYSIMRVTFK